MTDPTTKTRSDEHLWLDTLCLTYARLCCDVELVDALQTYIVNNRDRMDYPSYRAAGLRVGSGAIESANFHVTGNRLKLQGMRWSELGAADMAMRADLFNGRWRARTEEMLAA